VHAPRVGDCALKPRRVWIGCLCARSPPCVCHDVDLLVMGEDAYRTVILGVLRCRLFLFLSIPSFSTLLPPLILLPSSYTNLFRFSS
jgi:hypothetical protein